MTEYRPQAANNHNMSSRAREKTGAEGLVAVHGGIATTGEPICDPCTSDWSDTVYVEVGEVCCVCQRRVADGYPGTGNRGGWRQADGIDAMAMAVEEG